MIKTGYFGVAASAIVHLTRTKTNFLIEDLDLYQINTKTRHINRLYFPITALKIISIATAMQIIFAF